MYPAFTTAQFGSSHIVMALTPWWPFACCSFLALPLCLRVCWGIVVLQGWRGGRLLTVACPHWKTRV